MTSIVITGGLGFLGQNLARAILQRTTTPLILKLVDIPTNHAFNNNTTDTTDSMPWINNIDLGTSTIEIVLGDISDPTFCDQVIDQNTTSVYHLAAAMSGACETDPTLAMQTNVLGTMNLLSSVKKRSSSSSSSSSSSPPTFVFASSGAVFGTNEGVVSDTTKLLPETTYGMTKSICEMLINGQSLLYACLSPPPFTLAFTCTD